MGRSSFHQRLATRFTQPRLITRAGTVFVAPQPVELESYFGAGSDDDDGPDGSLSAFERLLEAERYQLVLSMSWGSVTAPGHTLDLGLLRLDTDKLFVVHQVNDDAGTSLIVAYLAATAPMQLFRLFLVDYLSSQGTGYTVNLPCLIPQTIWIVEPELATQATVATGLLGLVTPGSIVWSDVLLGASDGDRQPHAVPVAVSLVA